MSPRVRGTEWRPLELVLVAAVAAGVSLARSLAAGPGLSVCLTAVTVTAPGRASGSDGPAAGDSDSEA